MYVIITFCNHLYELISFEIFLLLLILLLIRRLISYTSVCVCMSRRLHLVNCNFPYGWAVTIDCISIQWKLIFFEKLFESECWWAPTLSICIIILKPSTGMKKRLECLSVFTDSPSVCQPIITSTKFLKEWCLLSILLKIVSPIFRGYENSFRGYSWDLFLPAWTKCWCSESIVI